MTQNFAWVISLIFCSLAPIQLFGQQQYHNPGPATGPCDCQSCSAHGEGYFPHDQFDVRAGTYFDQGVDAFANGPPRFAPIRNAIGNAQGRFGGQNQSYGRPGNINTAPYIDGKCGDCNWGPFYLSLFAGVGFIDNLDSRFTFDNGNAGELGVRETGFTTLDGVSAGGAIGRYFYRQARLEFEYTFRGNGVGDMTEFTYDDILATPQINDVLVSSVVTPADGNIDSNSFMWNILIDLTPRTVGCMNLYAGGGLGVLYVDGDIATPMAMFDINDTSLAFQGIVGVNFPVRERVDLFTEYRYLGADSIGVSRFDMAGTTDLGSFRFDSHSMVFGLRFLR